ncbi:hypothetical protein PRK78_003819 [Emydomyces testavorans]|uniref:Uncharacterized protein n=1 Tax=Emydomyces testavorans TaxID=2070801 RepID=A0AAF0DGQ5_9EURO|nr:hypothetical protein PRK78_003819 [Emydomyces testavorans]
MQTMHPAENDPNLLGNARSLDMLAMHQQTLLNVHALREEMSEVKDQLMHLSTLSDCYLQTRSQFIDVFKRDVLQDNSVRGSVKDANRLVHSGNAAMDLQLYRKKQRHDPETFEILYGLSLERVEFLDIKSAGQ